MINYDSPTEIKKYLNAHDLGMQKKFGQNFLINAQARKKIIDALLLQTDTTIWEIGPGLGCMTTEILAAKAKLTAFEIDRGFSLALNDFFSANQNFTLIEGDVLKTWKTFFHVSQKPERLFGNLPYNIAAVLFADFICSGVVFERGVITIQKEVALRMTAKPNSKDYSSFSVLCQWAYDLKPLLDLAAGCFWPRPQVDSRAVIFTKKENPIPCANSELFVKLLRALFASRRKTIKNNLSTFLGDSAKTDAVLQKAQLNPQNRAENLSLEQIICLSNLINSW